MGQERGGWGRLSGDWRAVALGAAAAPALLLTGLVVGQAEGLLPGECEGLACLFPQLLLGYTVALVLVWAVIALVVAATRRRWPRSSARTWIVAVLAVLSWGLPAWVVVNAL